MIEHITPAASLQGAIGVLIAQQEDPQ